MNDPANPRNPTGLVPTQQQIEESTREDYKINALRYGLEYYVAGRFAIAHHFTVVGANLLHHAVELLLKANLSRTDSLDTILKYGRKRAGYSHNLLLLWAEFKRRQPAPVPDGFDTIVEGLHNFADIRYPDKLVQNGALIMAGIFEVDVPLQQSEALTAPTYVLMLPQIDRLMGLLFDACNANPEVFLPRLIRDQGMTYYEMIRRDLVGRPPHPG